jgi:inositol hexakisphosphate/diphosphoinositol-pentakisphosphate kinase
MQKVLWDRRLCLKILDHMGVPTPKRLEVTRDGGPRLESPELAQHMFELTGVKLEGAEDGTGGGTPETKRIAMTDDGDTIAIDGQTLKKPFVEKPVSGEDHNIHIYFPRNGLGGGRRLFRKIGNKSSEYDPNMVTPRCLNDDKSYLYEQFLSVENAEDVKAYTVGPDFCHAETRRSPVVDGLVRRNTHGKEIRYVTSLTKEEAEMATKISNGFGQRICGFDLLRAKDQSYVIDVNGWSFVKDNDQYYDTCAKILGEMFIKEKKRKEGLLEPGPDGASRKNAGHGHGHHRQALKGLLKSPSMSRLTGHHNEGQGHHHHPSNNGHHHISSFGHRTLSPTTSYSIPPKIQPPSLDRDSYSTLPNLNMEARGIVSDPDTITGTRTDSVISVDDNFVPMPAVKHSWKLKGMVAVIRHADRTPKQKFKFNFHSQPFIDLLKGHQEEVLLKGEAALNTVLEATKLAEKEGSEDIGKLKQLRTALARKGSHPGTKVQIKPMFRKRRPEDMPVGAVPEDSEHVVSSPVAATSNDAVVENSVPAEAQGEGGNDAHADMPRNPTRSDSISGATFSRFSAAEEDLVLDKLQLVMKWGGEPTHSARYQAQDLGENMRADMLLMNREALNDVRIFTSSEKRVSTSGEHIYLAVYWESMLTIVAQIWAASFLGRKDLPSDYIDIRKDLLDDSNAAKDVMDKVKKKLKTLLREGSSAPPQFAWPENMEEPSIIMAKVVKLMQFHRKVMRENYKKIDGSAVASLTAINGPTEKPKPSTGAIAQAQAVSSIQSRWCTGEDAELFKERWEKLFAEFCDSEKVDPSKISELYDSMKFDALHNRQFLEWVFTPSPSVLEEQRKKDQASSTPGENRNEGGSDSSNGSGPGGGENGRDKADVTVSEKPLDKTGKDKDKDSLAQKIGFRRKSVMNRSTSIPPQVAQENYDSYFKLFQGHGDSKAKVDKRLVKLRELYRLSKVLFDFVAPQEYGIEDHEKLEIGLLTSLPLLKEIVLDLEELQASDDAKSFIYFTKESHIYTLLNCILEGGLKTKISRNAIPELDYLSQICFELYEARDPETDIFSYSIRITISPGCHTFDPLDVLLDSKHAIGCAPRRSLMNHQDWKEVIETLRAKFHT